MRIELTTLSCETKFNPCSVPGTLDTQILSRVQCTGIIYKKKTKKLEIYRKMERRCCKKKKNLKHILWVSEYADMDGSSWRIKDHFFQSPPTPTEEKGFHLIFYGLYIWRMDQLKCTGINFMYMKEFNYQKKIWKANMLFMYEKKFNPLAYTLKVNFSQKLWSKCWSSYHFQDKNSFEQLNILIIKKYIYTKGCWKFLGPAKEELKKILCGYSSGCYVN